MLNRRAVAIRHDRRAGAMLEFAITVPILAIIGMSIYDCANIWVVERRLTTAAIEIAEIATNQAVEPNGNNQLNFTQLSAAGSAVYAYFPRWKTDGTQTFSYTISAIAMNGVPAGCTFSGCSSYVATTAWSMAGSQNEIEHPNSGFNWDPVQQRPCGVLPAATTQNTAVSPTPNFAQLHTIPGGMIGGSSLIVADVSTIYRPLFISFITGPISLMQSSFVPPRIGVNSTYVPFQTNSAPAAAVTVCPTYS